MPLKEQETALVPEEVRAKGRSVLKGLLPGSSDIGPLALLALVVIVVPAPEEPAARVDVGIDNKAARSLGELLGSNPGHDHVVDLIVSSDADEGHEILFDHAPDVVAEISPGEGKAGNEEKNRDVDVEVDTKISLDGGGEHGESRDKKVEGGELRRRRTESVVAAHGHRRLSRVDRHGEIGCVEEGERKHSGYPKGEANEYLIG